MRLLASASLQLRLSTARSPASHHAAIHPPHTAVGPTGTTRIHSVLREGIAREVLPPLHDEEGIGSTLGTVDSGYLRAEGDYEIETDYGIVCCGTETP